MLTCLPSCWEFFWVAHAQALRVLSQSVCTRICNCLCVRYCAFISSLALSLRSFPKHLRVVLHRGRALTNGFERQCALSRSLLSSSICHAWWYHQLCRVFLVKIGESSVETTSFVHNCSKSIGPTGDLTLHGLKTRTTASYLKADST